MSHRRNYTPPRRPRHSAASHPPKKDRSEVRLVRMRNRFEALVENIAIVFGTNHFFERASRHAGIGCAAGGVDTAIALDGVPRCRESAGVFHMHIHLHGLASLDRSKTLDDVKLLRVRRAVVVDKGSR